MYPATIALQPKQAAPVPAEFICPITNEIMQDPVMTIFGHNFERGALLEWLREHSTCPLSRNHLKLSNVVSNSKMQARIQDWCYANNHRALHPSHHGGNGGSSRVSKEKGEPDRSSQDSIKHIDCQVFVKFTKLSSEEQEQDLLKEARRRRRVIRNLARLGC